MSLKLKTIMFAVMGALISGCTMQEPIAEEDLTIKKEEITPPPKEILKDEPAKPIKVEKSEKIIEEESSIPTVEEEDVAGDTEEEEEMTEEPLEPSITLPDASLENNETYSDEMSAQESGEIMDEAVDENASMEFEEEQAEEKEFVPFIEHIGVLKIKISDNELRIMIKDPIIKHFYLSDPERIVIDFKPIRYFEPKSVTTNSQNISAIATATHDKYNRVVIYLKKKAEYAISKDQGDWLIDLK